MGHKDKKKHKNENNETVTQDNNAVQPISSTNKLNKLGKLSSHYYEEELAKLQDELVKLQYWVKAKGLRVVIIFEGRDAAGKGGVIKTINVPLNPRGCRVVALDKPSDKEATQWYFQRYVAHLPSAGEIVIFDRSWYNRAGVERVMGFCTDDEYTEFMRACPEFEKMLIRSGIILIKYWFSVSDEEQEKRFAERASNVAKMWKLSEMDIKCRDRWEDFSRAKDEMFKYTDTKQSPWFNVRADDKKKSRLNCISHLLSMIPYQDVSPKEVDLPERKKPSGNYIRPPQDELTYVPEVY